MSFPLMPFAVANTTLTSITLHSVTANSSSSITVPSTVRSGDLLILTESNNFGGSGGSAVYGSGMTPLMGTGYGGWFNGCQASALIATGATAGSTITGGTASPNKILYVYRGNVALKSFSLGTANAANTNGNPGTITISASGITSPAVLICLASAGLPPSWELPFTSPAFQREDLQGVLRTGMSVVFPPTATYNQNIDIVDFDSGNMMLGAWLQVR